MRTVIDDSEEIEFIIAFIYERSRIRLHDGKEALIRARLGKRMRLLGIGTLREYCAYIRSAEGQDEVQSAIDALTTNYTHFLREESHFQFLVKTALPALLTRGQRRFKVWSAACATGEEPYTIGMYLAEHFPLAEGWDWRVVASDISTKALAVAQQGVYAEERIRQVPDAWLRRHFQLGHGRWEGHYRVKASLAGRIEFRQLNLLEPYEHGDPFEIAFCRNVMIYFDRPTQEQLVTRLARFLVPRGYLLIGHSESLNGLDVPVHCLRPSIYQKK
jgi:chemotaxis protein methyltransferase CheR